MQNYMLHYSVEPQIHHITGKDSSFRQDVELLTLQIGKLNLSSHTKKNKQWFNYFRISSSKF